ncbi:hypothetical protein BS47DRAFT_1356085 [Hydnum rufescens UP504]|uniref:Uncharacterized protein n=1 Tax=Hydnum rufescens UP504 TaxID=1448309 RepID=A0A9P6ADI2_9AGAM|nr:hypothetical protein BS47DRAFT_1356085 [Hydnum rufescens UP504]
MLLHSKHTVSPSASTPVHSHSRSDWIWGQTIDSEQERNQSMEGGDMGITTVSFSVTADL